MAAQRLPHRDVKGSYVGSDVFDGVPDERELGGGQAGYEREVEVLRLWEAFVGREFGEGGEDGWVVDALCGFGGEAEGDADVVLEFLGDEETAGF